MSLDLPGESDRTDSRFSVIHLLVIGFHPRSGYRVEFCTPPLSPETSTYAEKSEEASDIQLPEEWECIRYLALPDGAHNHDQGEILNWLDNDLQINKEARLCIFARNFRANKKFLKSCYKLKLLNEKKYRFRGQMAQTNNKTTKIIYYGKSQTLLLKKHLGTKLK